MSTEKNIFRNVGPFLSFARRISRMVILTAVVLHLQEDYLMGGVCKCFNWLTLTDRNNKNKKKPFCLLMVIKYLAGLASGGGRWKIMWLYFDNEALDQVRKYPWWKKWCKIVK